MERLGSHWTDLHEVIYLSIFRKAVKKIQVSLKSDNNSGCFTWRQMYIFLSYISQFFLEWEIFQTKVVGEMKTLLLNNFFFRKSCCLWDNAETFCRAEQVTDNKWRLRIACWIPKSTTHTQYVILLTSPFTTMFARTRLHVTLHVHNLSCSASVQFVKWAYSSVALFIVFPCYYSL